MTASERLKALAPGPNDWFVPYGWPDPDLSVEQGSAVWDALVTVVEAAETLQAWWPDETHGEISGEQFAPIRAALAALDETLS